MVTAEAHFDNPRYELGLECARDQDRDLRLSPI